jgi:hypothetical protein
MEKRSWRYIASREITRSPSSYEKDRYDWDWMTEEQEEGEEKEKKGTLELILTARSAVGGPKWAR